MPKIPFGQIPLVYPIPIILAGALVDDHPNYATLGDCGVMGIKPPLVYISLNATHHTTQGVIAHGTYSINIPTAAMLAAVDYCGMVSGRDVDKAALFETFYGGLDTAPMIAQCPVNIECRVVKDFTIEHRHIFVGEVVQTYVDETYTQFNGERHRIVDLGQLDPIIYALDNCYYRIGDVIGTGYQEGKQLQSE